jgi:hypothetical protein
MGMHSPAEVHARLMDDMARARCIREAACLVVLGQTGTEFDPGVIEGVWGSVAAVAEEYGASPDEVQQALVAYEPSLAIGAEQ